MHKVINQVIFYLSLISTEIHEEGLLSSIVHIKDLINNLNCVI